MAFDLQFNLRFSDEPTGKDLSADAVACQVKLTRDVAHPDDIIVPLRMEVHIVTRHDVRRRPVPAILLGLKARPAPAPFRCRFDTSSALDRSLITLGDGDRKGMAHRVVATHPVIAIVHAHPGRGKDAEHPVPCGLVVGYADVLTRLDVPLVGFPLAEVARIAVNRVGSRPLARRALGYTPGLALYIDFVGAQPVGKDGALDAVVVCIHHSGYGADLEAGLVAIVHPTEDQVVGLQVWALRMPVAPVAVKAAILPDAFLRSQRDGVDGGELGGLFDGQVHGMANLVLALDPVVVVVDLQQQAHVPEVAEVAYLGMVHHILKVDGALRPRRDRLCVEGLIVAGAVGHDLLPAALPPATHLHRLLFPAADLAAHDVGLAFAIHFGIERIGHLKLHWHQGIACFHADGGARIHDARVLDCPPALHFNGSGVAVRCRCGHRDYCARLGLPPHIRPAIRLQPQAYAAHLGYYDDILPVVVGRIHVR